MIPHPQSQVYPDCSHAPPRRFRGASEPALVSEAIDADDSAIDGVRVSVRIDVDLLDGDENFVNIIAADGAGAGWDAGAIEKIQELGVRLD